MLKIEEFSLFLLKPLKWIKSVSALNVREKVRRPLLFVNVISKVMGGILRDNYNPASFPRDIVISVFATPQIWYHVSEKYIMGSCVNLKLKSRTHFSTVSITFFFKEPHEVSRNLKMSYWTRIAFRCERAFYKK